MSGLIRRIRETVERSSTLLQRLAEEVETPGTRVNEHLMTMGVAWK